MFHIVHPCDRYVSVDEMYERGLDAFENGEIETKPADGFEAAMLLDEQGQITLSTS